MPPLEKKIIIITTEKLENNLFGYENSFHSNFKFARVKLGQMSLAKLLGKHQADERKSQLSQQKLKPQVEIQDQVVQCKCI